MNHQNHFLFAKQVVKSCGLEEQAVCLANLPSFLGRGSLFHDTPIYTLPNLPVLISVSFDVFFLMEKNCYDIAQTRENLKETLLSLEQDICNSATPLGYNALKKKHLFYVQLSSKLSEIHGQYIRATKGSSLSMEKFFKENLNSLFLAILAFIYFDLWIAPRMIFAPEVATCSGAWHLWENIDYSRLVERFCVQDEEFCSDLFEGNLWDSQLDPFSLIKGIIIKMGEMGSPAITYSVIDWNIRVLLRFLGVNDYKKMDAELRFLDEFETRLVTLFSGLFKKQ